MPESKAPAPPAPTQKTPEELQAAAKEMLSKMLGDNPEASVQDPGMLHMLQTLKQMSSTMESLQKMKAVVDARDQAPASPAPASGGDVNKLIGEMLGKSVGKETGDKLAAALAGKDGETIKKNFAEVMKSSRDKQLQTSRDVSNILLASCDQLQELLNRPRGSDLTEMLQKLGDVLGQTYEKVQNLTVRDDPSKSFREAIDQLIAQGSTR